MKKKDLLWPAVAGALAGAAVFALLSWARPTLRAGRFELVDARGRVRGVLGFEEGEQAMLELRAGEGPLKAALSAGRNVAGLYLFDGKTARLVAAAGTESPAQLQLLQKDGAPGAFLTLDERGRPIGVLPAGRR